MRSHSARFAARLASYHSIAIHRPVIEAKMKTLPSGLFVCVALCSLAATSHAQPSSWPTLHRDNQRSGHTAEVIGGPYERKWFRDFHDEMIASRVEAIVAEGLVFVGTFAGKVHAL